MVDRIDVERTIKKYIPTVHQWHEGCQDQVFAMVNEILKQVDKINELPTNRPLYKDSGLWQIRSDDMEDVLYQQEVNETFLEFIERAHKHENEWQDFR